MLKLNQNNEQSNMSCELGEDDDDDDEEEGVEDDDYETGLCNNNSNDDDDEMFKQFNKLKHNFYRKYFKNYEDNKNDDLDKCENNDNDDDNEEDDANNDDFYDALSENSFNNNTNNKNYSIENAKSHNISLDNLSSLSQDELKLLELKRYEVEKFKNQEEYFIKKIEELTHNHFSQVELLENQQKLAVYNEKCRNELNDLRKHYNKYIDCVDNSNVDNTNEKFNVENSVDNVIDNKISFNEECFFNTKKYSTYSPSPVTSTSIQASSNVNSSILTSNKMQLKCKTWPEKEVKNCFFNANNNSNNNSSITATNAASNTQDDSSNTVLNEKKENKERNNDDDDDEVDGDGNDEDLISYLNRSITALNAAAPPLPSTTSTNNRKYSHADSFESALTNLNCNDDLTLNTGSTLFEEVFSQSNDNDKCEGGLEITTQNMELINPVDKQIMQLKNINQVQTFNENYNSDEEENSSKNTDSISIDTNGEFKMRKRDNIKKVFHSLGKAVRQVKTRAEEVLNQEKKEESDSDEDYEIINEADKIVKHKSARSFKGSFEFDKLKIVQILNSCATPLSTNTNNSSKSIIWTMKFSPCGKFLATAGKDTFIKIWILRSYYKYYKDLIKNYNKSESNDTNSNLLTAPTSFNIQRDEQEFPFYSKPFIVYQGHNADILDLSWSKNLFLLSASSDKTVRLWHIYKNDCLCCFYHSSIVSTISFHPKDDRFFISACLAGKLRLWNISEKKVIRWNELSTRESSSNFITAICFCQSGKTIAVGTYDGKCILYQTELLKYYSLINVRSTRGRNSKGSKITGIEVLYNDENKLLITSNDSRIRLYDLRDLSLICKYRGFTNSTVHIKASLSPDDKFIICASENKWTYIWRTNHHTSLLASATGIRRDRNMYFERIKAHNSIITCALFSPNPSIIYNQINLNQQQQQQQQNQRTNNKKSNSNVLSSTTTSSMNINNNNRSQDINNAHCIVSAGSDGVIKIFVNKLF